MPLTAIKDFAKIGETNPVFALLAKKCDEHKGLWNIEAEQILLDNADKLKA